MSALQISLLLSIVAPCRSFISSGSIYPPVIENHQRSATSSLRPFPPPLFDGYQFHLYSDATTSEEDACEGEITLKPIASAGIEPNDELPALLTRLQTECEEYSVKINLGHSILTNNLPCLPKSIPGALGRVISFQVQGVPPDYDVDDDEFLSYLKVCGSELKLVGGQPILFVFQTTYDEDLEALIEKEVSDYGMKDELICLSDSSTDAKEKEFIPSLHIELDGAMIENIYSPGETLFDTSSILVFDDLLEESLRKRLLNVVKGYPENTDTDEWNDIRDGPDPNRWVRGGLIDVVDDEAEKNEPSCWGLTDEAIMDICFGDHPAVLEFESKLAQLFPDFIVTRLPEAVFGACVSPLTANAPTHGDSFNYHIDADPLQMPDSPWSDVFGLYPNRSLGKPRFVSCLLYLNDEWNGEEWGAPTEFLDPPTEETVRVLPQPGRCVIMDQDISHTVVPPNSAAGKRPRYSLVWKLILHPRTEGQEMSDLTCGNTVSWPDPIVIGSANNKR